MTDDTLRALVRATRYEVSPLPPDDPAARDFTLTVEERRSIWRSVSWVVTVDGHRLMDRDGRFEYGPYGTSEEWIAAHFFDEKTALDLATEYAPTLRNWRGQAATDVLAARAAGLAEEADPA